MQCTRAAIVKYQVHTSPLLVETPDVPEETRVILTVEAQIARRLLTVEAGVARWPDAVAAPLLEATSIRVLTTERTIRPDGTLWQEWRARVHEREDIVRQWGSVVTQLASTIPRKKLAALAASNLSEDQRRLLRFGQQVEAILVLPTAADGVDRCREVVGQLAPWVDAAAMEETAERFYRVNARVDEDGAAMMGELQEAHKALSPTVEAEFLDAATRGYCLPEERYAFLDDTLFVFDGQYGADEMRMLMVEYLGDLRRRMEQTAVALDWKRDLDDAERPGDIPERVRALVWRRDRSRCVVCQETTDLEFDHIIPRSLGGASTVKNVQVLCRRCNERKRAQVARMATWRVDRRSGNTLSLFAHVEHSSGRESGRGA